MPIQQLFCDFNHLSMPLHLGPCQSNLCSRTSTEGAAVYTGCVGGGEAVPRRAPGGARLGRPLRRITPPPGHYELGAVGLHRRSDGAPTSGVGPDGGFGRTRTARGARRLAPKTKNEPVPGVLLPSLHREAIPTRSSARKDRETDDARSQAPDAPASQHLSRPIS